MKILATIATLLIASPAYACLSMGDRAEAPDGQAGEVTYAHCDIDGFEAYEITFDNGSTQRFEMALDENPDGLLPKKVKGRDDDWQPIDQMPD